MRRRAIILVFTLTGLLLGCRNELDVEPVGFEFIVVGSGAGGGPLAARLAREGRRVLLLEAGSDVGGKLEYQVPALHAASTEDEDAAWWFFVSHHDDDVENSKYTPEGLLYPRGSALGGSTAVNAMVTVLPSRSDWNRLAEQTGEPGFRASNMDRYIDRVREWLPLEQADPALAAEDVAVSDFIFGAASVLHDEGELTLESDPRQMLGSVSEMARLLVGDVNEELRAGETTGLFRLPTATKNGKRHGTRENLLNTVAEGYPLTIKTNAFVTRVAFTSDGGPPRAVGVHYVEGKNLYKASLSAPEQSVRDERIARASREVILSAGVFNSPQLLMLSGIGEREHLEANNISQRVELPVGRNLQDRYEVAVVTELDEPLSLLDGCSLGQSVEVDPSDPCIADWQQDSGHSAYGTNGFLASALVRSDAARPLADLQIFASPSYVRGYYPGYSADSVSTRNHFSWLILKAHNNNHDGRVSLKSNDPFDRVGIRFNSYDAQDPLGDPDLRALVEGVKRVRRFAQAARLRAVDEQYTEVWPGPAVQGDEAIADWARKESWGHHACCTNPIGDVLDARFRVKGTEGLRVVDASVFPDIPGTFIAMPIFMASERAADLILEDNP